MKTFLIVFLVIFAIVMLFNSDKFNNDDNEGFYNS